LTDVGVAERRIAGTDLHLAAVGHGVARVDQEVHQCLLELNAIADH